MNRPLRACIIGISGHGENHYQALLQQIDKGEMQIRGATVVNRHETEEQCAKLESLGAEIFTDYQAMFARLCGKIDFCFIPTGIHLHAPMSIAALRAGAHVLVEKPLTGAIQDALAMQDGERETGRQIAVGYNHMYSSSTWQFKEMLRQLLGRVTLIKSGRLEFRLDNYYSRNGWAGRLKAGDCWVLDSPFNNACAHQLNLMCFFAGDAPDESALIESVQAELYRGNNMIESADTACLRIVTGNGIKLYFYTTHCSNRRYNGEFEIHGERGTIAWREGKTFFSAAGKPCEEIPILIGLATTEEIVEQVKRKIAGQDAFFCDLKMAAAQTICANGAHESSLIHPVPKEAIIRIPQQESVRTEIIGIDDAIQQAFQEEKLLSEINVPWAKPGKAVSMKEYRCFSGGAEGNKLNPLHQCAAF